MCFVGFLKYLVTARQYTSVVVVFGGWEDKKHSTSGFSLPGTFRCQFGCRPGSSSLVRLREVAPSEAKVGAPDQQVLWEGSAARTDKHTDPTQACHKVGLLTMTTTGPLYT